MKSFLVSLLAAALLGSAVLATATTAEAIERGWGYGPYYGYAPYAPEYAYGPGYGNAYAPGSKLRRAQLQLRICARL
jgi:hypothetical protein